MRGFDKGHGQQADDDRTEIQNIESIESILSYSDNTTGLASTTTGRFDNQNTTDSSASSTGSDENLPLGQAIKRYPKIVGYCLALTVIVVGWGYDLVLVGAVVAVEPFQRDYGEVFEGGLIIPYVWLSLWNSATPMGMAMGSIFGGWLQDRVGRRFSLLAGSIICAMGVAIIFFSYLPSDIASMRVMFFVGKVVQGFSIGTLKVTAMTYISEVAPTALRGSTMALIPTGNLLGQLLGSIVAYVINGVNNKVGYLGAFASQWILALVPFLLFLVLPESPVYLEEKNRSDAALDSATRLYAPKTDPVRALEAIRQNILEEKTISADATYIGCFRGTNLRRTWIVILANLFPALFGLDLLAKSSYFLQIIGMKSSISLMILIGGIVAGTAANGLGIWVLSKVGRRKVSIISLAGAGIFWCGIGVTGFWDKPVVAYVVAGVMIAIIIVCGMGVWPAAYAVMGEASSLRLRAKTQGLGGVAQQASSVGMSFAIPYAFNPDVGDLGGKSAFVYGGTCLIAILLCWFYLPEMKGRTPAEIDHMFNIRLPTRQFGKYKVDDESREE
ncbi:hypothetical protein jhhlp_004964 [Lomentospora prolificans]|uniref:Major facilitator superfamily (MFS) profile domain-containing protein n=1 Tax=Lomentospora prolificans TaxID=41688 RepID=A0A2N3N826_9PEZI|nr:hypothetical protein jhhlp_004964 [Lomentospora prolificans]